MQSKCSQNAVKMQPKCSQNSVIIWPNAVKMQLKCSQNAIKMQLKAVKMQPKCILNAVKMQSKCSQNAVEMQPNAVKMQSKCSRNAVELQSKCSQNTAKIQSLLDLLTDWKVYTFGVLFQVVWIILKMGLTQPNLTWSNSTKIELVSMVGLVTAVLFFNGIPNWKLVLHLFQLFSIQLNQSINVEQNCSKLSKNAPKKTKNNNLWYK